MFLEMGKGRGEGQGEGQGEGDSGWRLVWRWRGVFLEGGVAGGIPPAQGRAAGSTAQKTGVRSEKRLRLTVAELL